MSIVLDGTSGITTPEIVSTGGPLVVNASAPDNSVVVNASGNVGIGTSSPQGKTESKTAAVAPASPAYGQKAFVANIPYATANITSSLLAAYDTTIHGVDVGYAYNGTGYDLIFATNSTTSGSPTERARIDSSGNLLVGSSTPIGTGGRVQVLQTANTTGVGVFANDASTYTGSVLLLEGARATTNFSWSFLRCFRGGDRLYIQDSGNVTNANNSYGGISDIKLKENIVDATPKLDKLNQVRVVNYNLKTDPDQELLGVVAQELEQIFPGMVEEAPDRDAEGNDLGTVTKAVKYSVFVPMLIKGLQELKAINDAQAQTIESLTARVVALEQA